MIKRTGHIVIRVLLLLATGGIPITRHYCGSTAMSEGRATEELKINII